MKSIHIQIASPTNWRGYKKIRLEALQNDSGSYRNSYEETKHLEEHAWKDRLSDKNSVILLAKFGNRIIGMAGILISPLNNVCHIAKFFEIYVNLKYRKHGIGEMLLCKLEGIAIARGVIKFQLMVNTQNGCAVSLYEKLGFKKVGRLKKELKVDNKYFDEYVMEKIIQKEE